MYWEVVTTVVSSTVDEFSAGALVVAVSDGFVTTELQTVVTTYVVVMVLVAFGVRVSVVVYSEVVMAVEVQEALSQTVSVVVYWEVET